MHNEKPSIAIQIRDPRELRVVLDWSSISLGVKLRMLWMSLISLWLAVNFEMKQNNENIKDLIKGTFFVFLIGAGLVVLMSLVMGRSPVGGGEEGLIYKTVDDKALALWIYKPRNWKANDRRPCVVWFFGGAWKVGTPEQFAAQSKYLAKRGMVAVTVEYRIKSLHGSTPVESTMDARSAMRWVKIHSAELGIDPERIAAGGGSSGGQLALACEVLAGVNDTKDNITVSPKPAALILFNPAANLDIPQIRDKATDDEFSRLLEVSPQQRLSSALPPTVIFHGTADAIIPEESVAAFIEKARSLGSENITYHAYHGRGHEFYYGPGSRQDYKDTLSKTVSFLESLGWLPR